MIFYFRSIAKEMAKTTRTMVINCIKGSRAGGDEHREHGRVFGPEAEDILPPLPHPTTN